MRSGQFSQGGKIYGYGFPLSFVHPPDNKMPGQFIPEIEDAFLKLTLEQKMDLQNRIDDLYQVLRGERRYLTV